MAELILICLLGYLIGSVPFALVIGRVFYHTDVRCYGSGNLGGSNTGRVLGKKAGLCVMTLDLLKVTLVVWLSMRLSAHPHAIALGGIAAALGHCFPLVAEFRGGKAVAGLYGFLFGLWVCAGYSPSVFFVPLAVFMTVLVLFKIVSLSSICSAMGALLWICVMDLPMPLSAAVLAFTVLIIVRHHENIRRMVHGCEAKITWM